MKHHDKLSRLLHIIKSSINMKREVYHIRNTKFSENLIKLLCKEGIVKNYKINENNTISMYFPSWDVTLTFKRISKSSRRIYIKSENLKELKKYPNKIYILSTNEGLLTHEEAHNKNKGGEIMCEINISPNHVYPTTII